MPTADVTSLPATTPTCLGCDYPLISLATDRCPECGRPFNLQVRETYGPRMLRDYSSHPVLTSIVVQFAVFIVGGMLYCGCGDDPTWGIVFSTIIANWFATAIVVARRRRRVSYSDLLVIEYGSLYFLAPAILFAMTIPGWLRPIVPLAMRFW